MHTYEVELDGEVLTVLATTWRRDLGTGETVFVSREPDAGDRTVEHEVLRLAIDAPHRWVRRRP